MPASSAATKPRGRPAAGKQPAKTTKKPRKKRGAGKAPQGQKRTAKPASANAQSRVLNTRGTATCTATATATATDSASTSATATATFSSSDLFAVTASATASASVHPRSVVNKIFQFATGFCFDNWSYHFAGCQTARTLLGPNHFSESNARLALI
jgi:hypothetical protein